MRKVLGVDVTSSVDPNAVSMTFKGIALGLVPVIILIARSFGLEIVETDLVQIINALATIVAMSFVIYGGVRRYINFKK